MKKYIKYTAYKERTMNWPVYFRIEATDENDKVTVFSCVSFGDKEMEKLFPNYEQIAIECDWRD